VDWLHWLKTTASAVFHRFFAARYPVTPFPVASISLFFNGLLKWQKNGPLALPVLSRMPVE
jgi:hypothetical protein